jgi:integrase
MRSTLSRRLARFQPAALRRPGTPYPVGTLHRDPKSGQTVGRRQRFCFPGRSGKKPMSNMVLLMTMRRLKSAYTVHGFRSAFRDWASERTNFSREICEAALAHIVRDKTEAAYRRGDLFEKRRELMATWTAFASGSSADIILLRGAVR